MEVDCRVNGMPPHVIAMARREVQSIEERENSLTGSLLCIQAEMMVRFSHPSAFIKQCSGLKAVLILQTLPDFCRVRDTSMTAWGELFVAYGANAEEGLRIKPLVCQTILNSECFHFTHGLTFSSGETADRQCVCILQPHCRLAPQTG